jgi:hypothetical protein
MSDMTDDVAQIVESDLQTIPVGDIAASNDRELALKLSAHLFLRLWTRIAIETGQRFELIPSQFVLGTYDGRMQWSLSPSVNFSNVTQIELGTKYARRHALIAETYEHKDKERVRLRFSIQEDEVRGEPMFVDYLVYDESATNFNLGAASEALRPALGKWFETILKREDAHLLEYCKGQLEVSV